jgi:hypothetical protein
MTVNQRERGRTRGFEPMTPPTTADVLLAELGACQ